MERLQLKSLISSDDDDDDYELPSLAERVKVAIALRSSQEVAKISHEIPKSIEKISSESGSEEDEIQKLSERIRSTPFSQTKCQPITILENTSEKSNIMKDPDPKKDHALLVRMKLDFSISSESEDELSTLNSNRKPSEADTQNLQVKGCLLEMSESDSDDVFSNLSVRLSMMNSASKANKGNYFKENEPDSDESFSNFVEELKTPLSIMRKKCSKSNNSESDESFSSFVEKLQTPLPVIRKNMLQKSTESDSDDSFLKSINRCNSYSTPMSQNRNNRINSPLRETQNLENKFSVDKFQNKGGLKSVNQSQTDNEKEFRTLFPPDVVNSSFLRSRATWTRKLFNFLNKKIFDSKLPEDMPIVWVASLKSTAGLTCCACKNNVYTCTIKLSLKLLISFDRLQNTLLHEMCHAAVWIINKEKKVRHGPLWQIWASRCKIILPFIECPKRCHNYEIQYSVWYRCTTCNWKRGRCKRVRKYEGAVCKRCKNPIIMTRV